MSQLLNTCGAYKVPEDIYRNEFSTLPSPVRASDCIACFVSGPIPTTASIGDTTLDVIRKENNPKKFEPDYNVYIHYMIKNSDGSFYISEPIKPDYHWAASEDLERIYGYDF